MIARESSLNTAALVWKYGFGLLFCVWSLLVVFTVNPALCQQLDTAKDQRKGIKFKLIRIADGKSDDGTWWKIFEITTSDGHEMYRQRCPFASIGRATKEFQAYLKLSEHIVRRTPEVDKNEKVVGERALVLLP